jgi:hypothetical protein
MSAVMRAEEIVEKSWWCPQCFALIEFEQPSDGLPHVVDYFPHAPAGPAIGTPSVR